MFKLKIEANVIVNGCPTDPWAAVEWRKAAGIPLRPDNIVEIRISTDQMDEELWRIARKYLNEHADIYLYYMSYRAIEDPIVLDLDTVCTLVKYDTIYEVTRSSAVLLLLGIHAAVTEGRNAEELKKAEEYNRQETARRAEEKRLRAIRDAEEAEKEKAEAEETARWAAEFGSPRLQRLLKEGIECGAVYRDERIALEYPGWRRYQDVSGHTSDARNASDVALELLDEARDSGKALTEGAELRWFVDDESDEWDEDGSPRKLWKGYVAEVESRFGTLIYGGCPSK
jgi:hypothetical protein